MLEVSGEDRQKQSEHTAMQGRREDLRQGLKGPLLFGDWEENPRELETRTREDKVGAQVVCGTEGRISKKVGGSQSDCVIQVKVHANSKI